MPPRIISATIKHLLTPVILPLTFLFGWLLAFPFHGPVLGVFAFLRGADPQSIGTAFVAAHGSGLLLAGLLGGRVRNWRCMMLGGGGVSLLLCAAMPAAGPDSLPVLFALCGAASAVFVVGWSVPYSVIIPPGKRITTMALIIVAANTIHIAIKAAVAFLPAWTVFAASLSSLIAAVVSAACLKAPERVSSGEAGSRGANGTAAEACRGIPVPLLFALCLLVFVLYINGGFMYLVLHPSAPGTLSWLPIFRDILYLAVLLLCAAAGSRIDRLLPVYAGASFIGLAFASYALFGATTAGHLAAESFSQASVALLDLFLWTILGDIAALYRKPLQVFGWGLSANVFGILFGGSIGVEIARHAPSPETVIALSAATTISLTFLLIPLLSARIGSDLVARIRIVGGDEADRSDLEKQGVPRGDKSNGWRLLVLRDRFPGFRTLTPRETEIVLELLEGRSNHEIAERLFIAKNTLKVHLRNIFRKLDVSNRSEFLAGVLSVYESDPDGGRQPIGGP